MKYTNIKKLLIKFMGGGLVNFPTRFLRWVKIDGDAEGDDGGGGDDSGDNSDIFFSPISIQPSYFVIDDEIVDIKDITVNNISNGDFLYSKESLVSIGVNEQGLDNLEQVSYSDVFDESNISKGWQQNDLKNIIVQNNLIDYMEMGGIDGSGFFIDRFVFENDDTPVIFKIGDNIYKIAKFQNVEPNVS